MAKKSLTEVTLYAIGVYDVKTGKLLGYDDANRDLNSKSAVSLLSLSLGGYFADETDVLDEGILFLKKTAADAAAKVCNTEMVEECDGIGAFKPVVEHKTVKLRLSLVE